jgi:hypothetical protein
VKKDKGMRERNRGEIVLKVKNEGEKKFQRKEKKEVQKAKEKKRKGKKEKRK